METPRSAPRPTGVAICPRLWISNDNASFALSEKGGDRLLVRFLLGVEHEELLRGIEHRLQLVARGAALHLQLLDGALQVGHARLRLRDEAVGEELGVLDDQFRL